MQPPPTITFGTCRKVVAYLMRCLRERDIMLPRSIFGSLDERGEIHWTSSELR